MGPIPFIYLVNTSAIEEVKGPPVMSVPALRGAIEMSWPASFCDRTNFTTVDTSAASLGKTMTAGVRSKMLVSRLYFFLVYKSSATSHFIKGAISSRNDMVEL